MKFRRKLLLSFCLASFLAESAFASEVLEETHTRVIVRDNPRTGKPYVSIVSSDVENPASPLSLQNIAYRRPDYRLLDPKIKSGQIPYDGPTSDRTKVYLFAASLAAVGTVGGAVGLATAPAATGAAASEGAGAYLAAGTAVVAAPVAATVALEKKPDPHQNDFDLEAKSEKNREHD